MLESLPGNKVMKRNRRRLESIEALSLAESSSHLKDRTARCFEEGSRGRQ